MKAESRISAETSLFVLGRNVISITALFLSIGCVEADSIEETQEIQILQEAPKLSLRVSKLDAVQEIPESEKAPDLKTLEFKHPLQGG